jgi:DNA replication protein DnaC
MNNEVIDFGRRYQVASDCSCRTDRIRTARLEKIPERYRAVTLESLSPLGHLRRQQKELIISAKQNPELSYFLAGRVGTGKTTLGWALYRHAVETNCKHVYASTLTNLLTTYKNYYRDIENGSDFRLPDLQAYSLRQNKEKYFVFLDDVDKARPTEFLGEFVYELIDAIYAYGHQIVVTTNMPVGKLIKHFDRANEQYGESIVRRMVDGPELVELF